MDKKTTVPSRVIDTIYYRSDRCLERINEIVQRQIEQDQRREERILDRLEKQAASIKRICENHLER